MRRLLSALCPPTRARRRSKPQPVPPSPQRQNVEHLAGQPQRSGAMQPINIISNHDFSDGLECWHSNCCRAYLASEESGFVDGIRPSLGRKYAVVGERSEAWQGLEQDISGKVSAGKKYAVTVFVGVNGGFYGPVGVQATLRLENYDSSTSYHFINRVMVSRGRWEKLEGSFSLMSLPRRVVFYLEGPNPGIDMLIDSVCISCEEVRESTSEPHFSIPSLKSNEVSPHEKNTNYVTTDNEFIIQNPYFEEGLNNWSGKGCDIDICSSKGKIFPLKGRYFASAIGRTQNWNGIQQEVTSWLQRKHAYEVISAVRIFGNTNSAEVRASLWVQASNGREEYIGIAKTQASDKEWVQLKGKFLINVIASKVVLYLEGPPPGTDLLVDSLVVKRLTRAPSSIPPKVEGFKDNLVSSWKASDSNVITNHDFAEGLHCWSLNNCNGYVATSDFCPLKGITAKSGTSYAVVTNRTETWQGLEQDITDKISVGSTYSVSAIVRIWGTQQDSAPVVATVKLEFPHSPPSYIFVGRAMVSKDQWEKLDGTFSLTSLPKRAMFYLEGPSAGIDLLVDSVSIACSDLKQREWLDYNNNIIKNSTFHDGLLSWNPLGSCNLKIQSALPDFFPSSTSGSHHQHQASSISYLVTTNRTETWMGPSQIITDSIKLHVTYQVTAWVRLGSGANGPQIVNVALGVDEKWVNGGQIEASSDRWYELKGSFRIEVQPSKVMVYIQGPSPGVDVMLFGLYIFPVDRKARFNFLKEKTEKVRKRDVILRFPASSNEDFRGAFLTIRQTLNNFPLGSCISRSNIENEDFVDFFLKVFSWAVFENELKWYHTEPQQGTFNYKDADVMLDFCKRHGIQTRGHCIFWDVEDSVQPWVRSLHSNDLMMAVDNRLKGLVTRYKGKFRHYDVNNEMLHGSFFQDRLGKDIRAYMFKETHRIDPSAVLFVNDYNIEDGCDTKSTPEKYINQILELQERGAPVGGIGIQGHINHPVGEIICDALDKLSILGLPIWFTEVDVSSENEYARADDLEVVLREAFAHPSVEGIMLWGFWELIMSRDNSYLVNAEGDVNEAGKRLLALKQEWLSQANGHVDTHGEFKFRGFYGSYSVEITTPKMKISRSFVVDRGDAPLIIDIIS